MTDAADGGIADRWRSCCWQLPGLRHIGAGRERTGRGDQQTFPLAPAAGRRRRFFFVITLELGRSGGTLLTPAPRATGSSTTVRSPPHGAEGLYGVLSLRHFAPTFRAGRMLLFIPWRQRRRAPTGTRSVSRRTCSRRLLADVADFFRDNAGPRAIGRHAADAGAASDGVIDNGPVATAWRGRAPLILLAAKTRARERRQ